MFNKIKDIAALFIRAAVIILLIQFFFWVISITGAIVTFIICVAIAVSASNLMLNKALGKSIKRSMPTEIQVNRK